MNSLRTGSHATVKFLSKETTPIMANKENSVFLFGQSSSLIGQKQRKPLDTTNDLNPTLEKKIGEESMINDVTEGVSLLQ